MSQLNNILKMIFILSKGKKVKGKEIASQLEVNEKQVRRYKEILDEFFNIKSVPGPNGGYIMEKSYFPFKEFLTKSEIEALKVSMRQVSQVVGIGADLDNIIDKINFNILKNEDYLSCSSIIPYSRVIPKSDEFYVMKDEIFNSILDNKEIWIEYIDNKNNISDRIVRPYKINIYKMDQYLVAWCTVRKSFREFKLTRIKKYRLLEKNFIRDIQGFEEFMKQKDDSIGIYSGEIYQIKLKVNPPMSNTISERIWVEDQKITRLKDGVILFEAKMNGGPEILSWILSMGSSVEVLEPVKLIKEIKAEIKNIEKNYI